MIIVSAWSGFFFADAKIVRIAFCSGAIFDATQLLPALTLKCVVSIWWFAGSILICSPKGFGLLIVFPDFLLFIVIAFNFQNENPALPHPFWR